MGNRILVNSVEYPCPIEFAMVRESNIVSEIKTMSGKTIADVNGWKYSDVTLKWEWIPNATLQALLTATSSSFTFGFKDVGTGAEISVEAIRKSVKCTETASTDMNGAIVWRGIEMILSFPECHTS